MLEEPGRLEWSRSPCRLTSRDLEELGGKVEAASIVGAPSGFDDAALTAARSWTFRAPRFEGKDVAGVAYLIFGFRMPV